MGCHFLLQCMKVKSESEVAQSCLTLSDLMDCSLPGSSVHGIFQGRVLERGAIAFSERSGPKALILTTVVCGAGWVSTVRLCCPLVASLLLSFRVWARWPEAKDQNFNSTVSCDVHSFARALVQSTPCLQALPASFFHPPPSLSPPGVSDRILSLYEVSSLVV